VGCATPPNRCNDGCRQPAAGGLTNAPSYTNDGALVSPFDNDPMVCKIILQNRLGGDFAKSPFFFHGPLANGAANDENRAA